MSEEKLISGLKETLKTFVPELEEAEKARQNMITEIGTKIKLKCWETQKDLGFEKKDFALSIEDIDGMVDEVIRQFKEAQSDRSASGGKD